MIPATTPPSEYRFLRIPIGSAEAAVRHLLHLPFEIGVTPRHYWLRYAADHEVCRQNASNIPAERFCSAIGNFLIRDGETIASETLPDLVWKPLKNFVQIELPKALFAGGLQTSQIAIWELLRGGQERPAEAALYDAVQLSCWADSAADNRLTSLRFCLARFENAALIDSNVLSQTIAFVIGKLLPPIPCQFLCRYDRVFIPAGFYWKPKLDASIVEQSFGLRSDEWLLWTNEWGWSTIAESECIPLSRASLRTTLREFS